jgi:predicted MPP superfamily phosphohydrolase
MKFYIPILFSIILGNLLTLSAGIVFKAFNRRFFNQKSLNEVVPVILLSIPLLASMWAGGKILNIIALLLLGASILALINLSALLLLVTMSLSLAIDALMQLTKRYLRQKSVRPKASDPSRRHFIKVAASALPALALGSVGTGMAKSFEEVKIPRINFEFPNLDPDLQDFRILHLSDLHLGYYFQLPNLENTLLNAEPSQPNLILITGDVADDLTLLPDAVNLINQLKTTHGAYISLGNHEYIRGIDKTVRIFNDGPIPLLVNTGVKLRQGNSELFIGGADDPKSMRSDIMDFINATVHETMQHAPENSFKILMSHRPRALDVAEKYNVDLILAGHTHGGQVGLNRRSVFEGLVGKEPYMWGKYNKGKSQLYTSSGLGHWFPFRLNCPAEAPLIILQRAIG